MKAARFDYFSAASADEAVSMLQQGAGSGKPLAGSQSLGPMLNLRLARPASLVDIARIEALREVRQEGGALRIGAAVTHAEIEDGVFPLLRGHPMQSVAERIAYRAVRNRGTLGGSLAHADPAADWVLTMAALGAQIEILGPSGTRRLPMAGFMLGAYTTDLASDELITAVHVPQVGAGSRWGYYKFCRKTGEFAEASCAAWFDPDSHVATVMVGALDGAPQPLPELAGQIAAQGKAALDALVIAAEVEKIAPGKDAASRRLFVSVIERCLRMALGE